MAEPLETVQEAYRALDRGDLLNFLTALHEQVEWHRPFEGTGLSGAVHQGQVSIVQNILAPIEGGAADRPVYAPDRFLAGPGHVVVLGRTTLDGEHSSCQDSRFAHLWLFDGPKASEVHAFEAQKLGSLPRVFVPGSDQA